MSFSPLVAHLHFGQKGGGSKSQTNLTTANNKSQPFPSPFPFFSAGHLNAKGSHRFSPPFSYHFFAPRHFPGFVQVVLTKHFVVGKYICASVSVYLCICMCLYINIYIHIYVDNFALSVVVLIRKLFYQTTTAAKRLESQQQQQQQNSKNDFEHHSIFVETPPPAVFAFSILFCCLPNE